MTESTPPDEGATALVQASVRWLLVIPAAIGGALAMAAIAVLIILFSGVASDINDVGTAGKITLVFITLSAPMASINIGAGQAPGHKEQAALVLAVLWAIGLTLALLYFSILGVDGVGNWIVLAACCVAGVTGVVWGFYYARTEGEAA